MPGNAVATDGDAATWREAGAGWIGGNPRGLTSKIGYLDRLGVTAIWVSPVLKQTGLDATYHGYGVQDFLEVDPHFGTADDLRTMVAVAHDHGIRVILDLILNHTGDVFAYDPSDRGGADPRWDGRSYRVAGFRDETGEPALPFHQVDASAWPDGAVWPAELQEPATFTQRGRIVDWERDPEYLDGDFFDLKNVTLGQRELLVVALIV
jgi:glycosidase